MTIRKKWFHLLGSTALVLSAVVPIATYACTRAVYLGPDGTVITVRSMDWQTDLGFEPMGVAAWYAARRRGGTDFHSLDIEVWQRGGECV